ncbi:hypothetical protein AB205_0145060 [Aquarana catesbeiana]|uniref:Uncharacterized protein n=1 Tax=Aquarana catesbeiana TaxID=8400 RepID=A0A2G9QKP7_AQUCT|nr:hypothetical protein AB205_0145060 [Aquarana catesbeiana]
MSPSFSNSSCNNTFCLKMNEHLKLIFPPSSHAELLITGIVFLPAFYHTFWSSATTSGTKTKADFNLTIMIRFMRVIRGYHCPLLNFFLQVI